MTQETSFAESESGSALIFIFFCLLDKIVDSCERGQGPQLDGNARTSARNFAVVRSRVNPDQSAIFNRTSRKERKIINNVMSTIYFTDDNNKTYFLFPPTFSHPLAVP